MPLSLVPLVVMMLSLVLALALYLELAHALVRIVKGAVVARVHVHARDVAGGRIQWPHLPCWCCR